VTRLEFPEENGAILSRIILLTSASTISQTPLLSSNLCQIVEFQPVPGFYAFKK
jgi:hypothetical protein